MFRIGVGYDVHRLAKGRSLVLGGVNIPFSRGLEGHSDADVLTHALMDAILGALSLGDLGTHFPDTDEKYRNISSITLLGEVVTLMQEKEYHIVNTDSVIIAQEPLLRPHLDLMKTRLAQSLKIGPEAVGLKSTTHEGMGSLGRAEGIASYSVVLLQKESS